MNQFDNHDRKFASVQARNIRYLYIIDDNINSEELLNLCYHNQMLWGGRYNPIIPSHNNEIEIKYLEFITCFDPDYILYSKNVDIQKIKNIFNPIEFISVNSFEFADLKGVDCGYLLNSIEFTILYENYLYKSMPELYSFYKLNFGFFNDYFSQDERYSKYEHVTLSRDNQNKLDEIITYKSCAHPSQLSAKNVSTPVFNLKNSPKASTQLIVANDTALFYDLIYYWNRQLFLGFDILIKQLFITTRQLEKLIKESKTPNFFASLSGVRNIELISLTLDEKDLLLIKEKLNQYQQNIKFQIGEKINIPFDFNDSYYRNNDEIEEKQAIVGIKDVLRLPKLSFEKGNKIFGKWIIDISIEKGIDELHNELLFPLNINLKHLFSSKEGRVNKNHKLSLIVKNEDFFIDFKMPNEQKIFTNLLTNFGLNKESKIERISASTDGMRLGSLFKLFDYNFTFLEHIFYDKFWLDVFRCKNILKDDARIKESKGVVSYKDLIQEYKNMFVLRQADFKEWYLKDMHNEVKDTLIDLVDIGAYFMGNKVKCSNCGSNLWYGLSELNDEMQCKGCFENISLAAESEIYYKLNDVIKNCLISNSGSKNDIHGNLTVLYTLIWKYKKSDTSFYCLPSQDYFLSNDLINPKSDIDIVCVSDGKLIIGEAKNSSKEFTNKKIEELIFLGNEIMPDELILAFNEGKIEELNKKIEDSIKPRLKSSKTKVYAYKTLDPYYSSRNLSMSKPRSLTTELDEKTLEAKPDEA